MSKPSLLLPEVQTPVPAVETRAKETQLWVSALPLADSLSAAQLLYQNLFALNRTPLDPKHRAELMELYRTPVSTVTLSLQNHFNQVSLPLAPKMRQLAVFLRQLQLEMAYGYKFIVRDLAESRALWGRKAVLALAVERAIDYLGGVLLRSYHVYMPCPPGTWREIHSLYRYAEEQELQGEPVPGAREDGSETATIEHSYLKTVLLGLCGPYQLPQSECIKVDQFLAHWAGKATLTSDLDIDSPVGRFLVDLTADLPAMLFPRDVMIKAAPYLRVLTAIELARVVHEHINRLQKGGSLQSLSIGMECIDSMCLDTLRRMIRFWGMAARRQYSRHTRKAGFLSICTGVNALHFFSDGQRPFSAPLEAAAELPVAAEQTPAPPNTSPDEAVIDLDVLIGESDGTDGAENAAALSQEVFRVSRWRIRDEGAGGLSLTWADSETTHVRVGDLLGVLDENTQQWRAGVARWLKSEDAENVEVGVEMLAPSAKPVAVRTIPDGGAGVGRYAPALMLPAVPALHQPSTLLLAPNLCQAGQDIYLFDGDGKPRRVRAMRLLERTGSFAQLLFADVARH